MHSLFLKIAAVEDVNLDVKVDVNLDVKVNVIWSAQKLQQWEAIFGSRYGRSITQQHQEVLKAT